MNSNNRERVAVGPVFGFAAEGDRREGFSRCNVLRWSRRNTYLSHIYSYLYLSNSI